MHWDWLEDLTERDLDALVVYIESGQAAEEWDQACENARWRLASGEMYRDQEGRP